MTNKRTIIGHQDQRHFLDRVIRGDIPHHVFVFHGPPQIGKHMIAEAFALHLYRNTRDQKNGATWEEVEHLTRFDDIVRLSPRYEKKKGVTTSKGIGVDMIRLITKRLARSHTGNNRILIIDDAQEMTVAAQNALLKVIEEPSANTYIIFVTSDIGCLLPTIRSRSVGLSFGLLDNESMNQLSDVSDYHIVHAYGRPGRAYAMHGDATLSQEVTDHLEMLKDIRTMNTHERITLAHDFSGDVARVLRACELWICRVRFVAHEHEKYSVLLLCDRIAQAASLLRTSNTNKRLVIEDLMINL